MAKKYTRRAEDSGWLSVKLTTTGQLTALCEYTAVETLREEGGRTYFTILDGYINVGDEASLKTPNAAKYLANVGPTGAATLDIVYVGVPTDEVSKYKGKLKQQWADLTFNGTTARVTLNSVWGTGFTPLAAGSHAIMAPDYSHAAISTAGYVADTPGMIGNDVWFPIGLGGIMTNSSRYVHVGHLSDGCVTCYELGKWTALYTYLISRRVAGSSGRRIGTINVVKPKRP